MRRRIVYWAIIAAELILGGLAGALLLRPAHAAPLCVPKLLGGTGEGVTTGSVDSPVVHWVHMWCPPANGIGEWKPYGVVWCPTCQSTPAKDFHAALARRDWAWMEAQATWTADNPQVLRSLRSAESVVTQQAAKPVALYTYRVAVNASSTTTPPTRPVYTFIAGLKGVVSVGRAVVGGGCNHTMEHVGDYMPFAPDFAPDRVTLCAK